jgi:hypothetical protein
LDVRGQEGWLTGGQLRAGEEFGRKAARLAESFTPPAERLDRARKEMLRAANDLTGEAHKCLMTSLDALGDAQEAL